MSNAEVLSKLNTTLFTQDTKFQPAFATVSVSLLPMAPLTLLLPDKATRLAFLQGQRALIRALLKALSEHSLPIPSYGGDKTHFV